MTIYKKLFEIKKANIKLQRDTKGYNYNYATLSQIQDKLSWEFEKQWLLITHSIINNCVVTSIIEVESWEKIESSILMSENIKPQDKWSEITYYRRYNLLSLLDLEVEDDDGEKAQDSNKIKKTQSKALVSNDELPWIGSDNIDKLADLIAEWKTFTMEYVKSKYKVSRANYDILISMWIK